MRAIGLAVMTNTTASGFIPEHLPVMPGEVLRMLDCRPGGVYVDGTVGLGGHAWEILERIQPDGILIGLDRDEESLEKARIRLQPYAKNIRLLHENFKNLPLVLNNLAMGPIHGILVEWNQHVVLVPHAAHRPVSGPNGKKSVAAANDGLVCVVCVNVETAAREDSSQDVTGAGNALPVFTTNPNRKINRRHSAPFYSQIISPNYLN